MAAAGTRVTSRRRGVLPRRCQLVASQAIRVQPWLCTRKAQAQGSSEAPARVGTVTPAQDRAPRPNKALYSKHRRTNHLCTLAALKAFSKVRGYTRLISQELSHWLIRASRLADRASSTCKTSMMNSKTTSSSKRRQFIMQLVALASQA